MKNDRPDYIELDKLSVELDQHNYENRVRV